MRDIFAYIAFAGLCAIVVIAVIELFVDMINRIFALWKNLKGEPHV